MQAQKTRITASVGSRISASGTSSTRRSLAPCKTVAFIASSWCRSPSVLHGSTNLTSSRGDTPYPHSHSRDYLLFAPLAADLDDPVGARDAEGGGEMKKNIENSGAPSRMPTTLAPVSVLKRKIRNGTRAGCERSSIATNAPISATDSASRATILVELRSTAPASTPFGAARGGELSLRCLSL